MNKLQAVLDWLRITEDGQVSLTNVALLVVLAKVVLAPTVGLTEISALLLGLLNYQSHRVIDNKAAASQQVSQVSQVVAADPRVDELAKQVSNLQGVVALKQSFGGSK